jgi:hypothetical protein
MEEGDGDDPVCSWAPRHHSPAVSRLGVSLTVCVIGFGLIASAVLPGIDEDDIDDLDFST